MKSMREKRKCCNLAAVSVHYFVTTFLEEVLATSGLSRKLTIYEIENPEADAPGVIRRKGIVTICPVHRRAGSAHVDYLEGEDQVGLADFMLSYTWG